MLKMNNKLLGMNHIVTQVNPSLFKIHQKLMMKMKVPFYQLYMMVQKMKVSYLFLMLRI